MSATKRPLSLLTFIFALCIANIVTAAAPYDAVCLVRMTASDNQSGGSGVYVGILDGSAVILTCKHVAEKNGDGAIVTFGKSQYEGIVAAVHPVLDCAVIVCTIPKGVEPASLARELPSPDLEPFVLCGYPGPDRSRLYYQIGKFMELSDQFLTVGCEPIPGMSGGACFNRRGEVTGLVAMYNDRNHTGLCTAGKAFVIWADAYLTGGPIPEGLRSVQ